MGRGLLRALGDLMEEELEAATDLQLTGNITQVGLDGLLATVRSAHSSPAWVVRMALTRSWCVATLTRRPRKAAAHAG